MGWRPRFRISVDIIIYVSLGCLNELAFALTKTSGTAAVYTKSLYVLWFAAFALWLFVRDANLFAIPATLALLIPVGFSRAVSNKRPLLVLAILLIALFILGVLTSRASPRWPPSVEHSLETFVFPYPARSQFLSEHFSMPDPGSADYKAWFDRRAPAAFSAFLVLHPGFVITTIIDNWIVFTFSYEQPYYHLGDSNAASRLLQLGEVLHPSSGVFYLLDTMLLLVLCAGAVTGRGRGSPAWAWILAWLYLVASLTLLLSYFGDTDGVMRHIFPSLEMFRLLMWLSILVLMDTSLKPSTQTSL